MSIVASRTHAADRLTSTVLPHIEASIDRDATERMRPEKLSELLVEPGTKAMLLSQRQALLTADDDGGLLLLDVGTVLEHIPEQDKLQFVYLGRTVSSESAPVGTAVVLVVLPEPLEPGTAGISTTAVWHSFRECAAWLNATDTALFIEASAISNWHSSHPYCPRCGAATNVEQSGWVRRCPRDDSEHYPRTDPAIIVTIVGPDDRVLLGGGGAQHSKMHSTFAGFVEPGESLEQAVAREMAEEVSVDITDVQYLGSQPWPFPASLMLGFTASTTTVDPKPDGVEVTRARWFTRAELQEAVLSGEIVIPSRISISRALIEHWYGGKIEEPQPA
ncbi:NAD(+) diphosphatase [Pseudarthrobacter sp. J1738]|uniref:NAD(+) diphosphatase n=1 Tax=unclassified Pseudarthrobacter TaxID=2647000 RepID=UPI003D29EEAD